MSRHAVEGRYGVVHSIGGVGASLEWFVDNIWRGADTASVYRGTLRPDLYAEINASVAESPACAEGLLFYPLAGGHDAMHARGGGFAGLALSHSRGDMARAVMEGIAFDLRWALDEIRGAGIETTELKMVGGAARSPVWPRIVADITGIPVALPAATEAASYGAAILAGVGAGLYTDPEAGFASGQHEMEGTPLTPSARDRRPYEELYARYRDKWAGICQRSDA
jgi:xylulokinase